MKKIDQSITIALNGFHTPFFDNIMLFLSNKYVWIPFYILILAIIIFTWRKKSILIISSTIIVFALCDRVSSGFAKPFFERLRPCHDNLVSQFIYNIGGCGGKYGFFSSHAANSFGFAMLVFLIFRKTFKHAYLILVWALLVSYSRVYLGVHYLGDILTGAIFGSLLAWLAYLILKKKTKLEHL